MIQRSPQDEPQHQLCAELAPRHSPSSLRRALHLISNMFYTFFSCILNYAKSITTIHHTSKTITTHQQGLTPEPNGLEKENESGQGKAEPRLINLSSRRLNSYIRSLLGKGPNYALTNRVTPTLLHSVEVGIERAFYGLKWKTTIESKRTARNDINTSPSEIEVVVNDDANTGTGSPLPPASAPATTTTLFLRIPSRANNPCYLRNLNEVPGK